MSRYTFGIYLANKQKKPGLVKSFLDTITIEADQPEIVIEDGSKWKLFLEPATKDYIYRNGYALCIISFQVFNDGEAIAVARIYQPTKK